MTYILVHAYKKQVKKKLVYTENYWDGETFCKGKENALQFDTKELAQKVLVEDIPLSVPIEQIDIRTF